MFHRFGKTKDNETIEITELNDLGTEARGVPQPVRISDRTFLAEEKKEKIVQEIISMFSREKLTYSEAEIVLEGVEVALGELSIVQKC